MFVEFTAFATVVAAITVDKAVPLTVIASASKVPSISTSPLISKFEAVISAKVTLLPVMANDAVDEFDTLASMFVCRAELEAFNCINVAALSAFVPCADVA